MSSDQPRPVTPLTKVVLRRKNQPDRKVVPPPQRVAPEPKSEPKRVVRKAPPPTPRPAWDEGMTKAELAAVAKGLGLVVKSKTTKTALIEMLRSI